LLFFAKILVDFFENIIAILAKFKRSSLLVPFSDFSTPGARRQKWPELEKKV